MSALIKRCVLHNLGILKSTRIAQLHTTSQFNDQPCFALKQKQQNLLVLPAFSLDETMEKYLQSTAPLLTQQEQESAVNDAHAFATNEGKHLHKLLQKAARKSDNWSANRWLRYSYLQNRQPLMIYSNRGITFPLQSFESEESYLKFTAKLIYGLLQFKQIVDRNELPIEKVGMHELDNSYFERIFGTCRVPGLTEDHLEFFPISKHISIINKNLFFAITVFDKNCKLMHVDEIYKALCQIMESNRNEVSEQPGIGLLTNNSRNNWYNCYDDLMQDTQFCFHIKTIQRSLFTVCLDEPFADGSDALAMQAAQLLHGGGSMQNSANRWMDKTLQLIVNRNGGCGICYERAPIEDHSIATVAKFIFENYACSEHFVCEDAAEEQNPLVEELIINVTDDKILLKMKEAAENVNKLIENLQIAVGEFKDDDCALLQQLNFPTNSFMPLAMQFAFYNLHQTMAAQCEIAHLRIFNGGRTEIIRSFSMDALAFLKAAHNSNVSHRDKHNLLQKAMFTHNELSTMAMQGSGIDQHLLGLKLMALENKLPVPKFFDSLGFKKSTHFRVCSSQLTTPMQSLQCQAPLVQDGYACCYNISNGSIIWATTAWRSDPSTCATKFNIELQKAIKFMFDLLAAYQN